MSNLLDKASIILTPTAYNTSEVLCVKPSDGTGDFDFSRATEATRINSQGLVETIGINLPRINYEGFSYDGSGNVVPDSGCGSWLWEPQSTNLITYSEDFSNAYWNKGGVSVAGGFNSPDGGANAFKLVEDTSSGTHPLYKNNTSVTASAKVTISLYAKGNGRDWIFIEDYDGNGGFYFDLKNGVIGTIFGVPDNYGFEEMANGWFRLWLTNTEPSTSADFSIYLADADNSLTYQGDGTSGLYIWGAQLEQQSYATSYIPTSGSSVTRNQDLCTNGGSLASINSTEGTLYAEIAALANDGGNRRISLNDGSDNNRINLMFTSVSNQIVCNYKANGTTRVSLSTTSYSVIDINKIAFKWKLGDFQLFVNGVKISTDNNTTMINANALNTIDFRDGNALFPFFGKNKALAVWKEALSDAELTELTTI